MTQALTILETLPGGAAKHRRYKVKCHYCNKEFLILSHNFKQGKGCSCRKHLYNDFTGKNVGKVKVLQLLKRAQQFTDKMGHEYRCECNFCGREKIYRSVVLSREGFLGCRCNKKDINHAAKKKVFSSYVTNAKSRRLSFELSFDEVISLCSQNCHYCGDKPSNLSHGTDILGKFKYNGIDRIDNSKGYIKGNIVTCCKSCNWMKQDMTFDEFKNKINRIFKALNDEK